MACKECFNNCDPLISDKCTKYTGAGSTVLSIEQGDSQFQVNEAVIAKLETVVTGTGITISGLTGCVAITNALGSNSPTVSNIFQALYTVICSLTFDVQELQDTILVPTSFNTDCLEVPVDPTKDDILQATVTKLCSVSTTVNTISSDYVTSANICSLVSSCLASSSTQEKSKMPKYIALPYHGPLNVFDASGNGIASLGYQDVYICIGQTVNGFQLPDYRGRSPLGVNAGVPTGSMDSAVDPSLTANSGYNVSKNTKKGSFTDTLSVNQIPSHTHSVNDPGHSHKEGYTDQRPGGAGSIDVLHPTSPNNVSTTTEVTGITINASGGSQSHNTMHPVIGAVFIMYVP